ncbi:unnamed protein product [Phytophthora lilii]|uniref:Unnamed protein product n=1 Tax=Phytophthora lilii TaxID=2077276 RepID=A0A9W6UEI7_9STRA|nr:unnamed protein product [Phytophthora lilii]
MRDMSLLRVEHEDSRRFYWIYNPNDAKAFNGYVGLRLHAECHEVFITPQCRFFFDIDLALDEMEKNDLAEAMGYPLEDGCDEAAVMELAWRLSTAALLQFRLRSMMYNVKVASTYLGEADQDFVKQALACIGSIPDFDPATFDVSIARMKGSCLTAKHTHRATAPSANAPTTRTTHFSSSAAPSEDDIESFASRKAKPSVSASDDEDPEAFAPPEDDALAAFATKTLRPTVKPIVKKVVKKVVDMDDPFDGDEPDCSDEAKLTTGAEIAVEHELLDINLNEIKANPESYDSMLLDLCKLVPTNWFKLVANIRSLARMIHQMAMSDLKVTRNTYLLTMAHHGGEWFDLKTVLAQYQRNGPPKPGKFLMGLSKLKQAAGGADKDAYAAWKSKYEPEPEEGSTSKASKRSSGDDEKKKPIQLMKEKMIRISDAVPERDFATDEMYHMSSQKDHNELLHFIKDITHPDFPFVKIDYDYIGFANGVYCLKDATFITRSFVPSGIQVRVYHDIDYEILEETPLLDKYFGYQFENKETIEFINFMFGRVLTTLEDKSDFMIMLVGVGGAGKSLLMNLHSHSFARSQIGILSSTFQGTFGLSEFATKQIVIFDDMPRNLAKPVPKSDFLSMQSRGRISCPVKGKTSIEVDSWDIGTIINSNDLPNYSDISGEIVRRIAIIKFNNAVPDEEKDNDLKSKIKATEYCTFLHRCRSTYLKYRETYRGKNIYTFCPQHFIDSRDELRGAINESFQFGKAHLEFAEGEKIAKSELTRMFRA